MESRREDEVHDPNSYDLLDRAVAEERGMHPIQVSLPTGFASGEDELSSQFDDELLGHTNDVQQPNTMQQYGLELMSQNNQTQHSASMTSPPLSPLAGVQLFAHPTLHLRSAAQSIPPQVAPQFSPFTPAITESTPLYLTQQSNSSFSAPQSIQPQGGQDNIAGQQIYSTPLSNELQQPGPLPYSIITGDYQPDLNYSLSYCVQVIVYKQTGEIAVLSRLRVAKDSKPSFYFLPGSEDKDWTAANFSGDDTKKRVLAVTRAIGLLVDSLEMRNEVHDDYNARDSRLSRTICYKARFTGYMEGVTESQISSYYNLPAGNRWYRSARLVFFTPVDTLSEMRVTQRARKRYHHQHSQDRDAFFIYENCSPEEKKEIMRQGVEEEGALSGVEDINSLKPLEHWGGLLEHIDLTKVVNSLDKVNIQEKRLLWAASARNRYYLGGIRKKSVS